MTPDLPLMINEDVSTMADDADEGDTGMSWITVVFRPPDILC